MLTRRDILTGAAAAVPTLALTKLIAQDVIPNCVYSKKAIGPTPNVIVCGDSCANEGMLGHYPNCYYPQYALLNRNLGYAAQAVANQTNRMVQNRTITQAQWNTHLAYHGAHIANLSLSQTTINDKLRIQYIASSIWQAPTQALINQSETWAINNGFDPGLIGWIVASTPAPANLSAPALHQQIMNLPLDTGADVWSNWIFAQEQAVNIPMGGICQYADPTKLIQTGEDMMITGAGISLFGSKLGEAGVPVGIVGDMLVGGGFMIWNVGKLCIL